MSKRVLILGGSGMLGHKLLQTLAPQFEVRATVRSSNARLRALVGEDKLITGVSGDNFDSIVDAFGRLKPDVVVNCIGLVKQLAEAKDPIRSLEINSLLPHRVSRLCKAAGARFIHISTDCVFTGNTGDYKESDPTDAIDLYGRSKALGEVASNSSLTIRTSIIGHQLSGDYGLVQWFLGQRDNKTAPGYTKAIFSGLPTISLSKLIGHIIQEQPELNGLYHVSSEPISKFELLRLMADQYRMNLEIVPDSSVVCDRSLNSQRFKSATGITIAPWPALVAEMHTDSLRYGAPEKQQIAR